MLKSRLTKLNEMKDSQKLFTYLNIYVQQPMFKDSNSIIRN